MFATPEWFHAYTHAACAVIAVFILVAAAFSDVKKLKISNAHCLALMALFPFYVLSAPHEIPWTLHLAVAGMTLLVGLALFALRVLGGGDAKMLTAAALWAGPKLIVTLLLATSVAGGVLAVAFASTAFVRTYVLKKKNNTQPWHKTPMPYGVAIACGGIATLYLMAQSF